MMMKNEAQLVSSEAKRPESRSAVRVEERICVKNVDLFLNVGSITSQIRGISLVVEARGC